MPGIRLHHDTVRSSVLVVETERVYSVPYMCNLCKKPHIKKSIHLRVDGEGDVIVARPVYEALRLVEKMGGFSTANEVEKPPMQYIGAVAQPKLHVVDSPLNRDQKAPDFYVPALTKYDSEKRIRIPKLVVRRKHGRP